MKTLQHFLSSFPPFIDTVSSTPKAEDHLGAGYRLVKHGEKLKHGDEYFTDWKTPPAWRALPLCSVGHEMGSTYVPHRRKLRVPAGVPPTGYRFLIEGEAVQACDRVLHTPTAATSAADYYALAHHVVGSVESDFYTYPFIRPIAIAPTHFVPRDRGTVEGYRLLMAGEIILSTDERWMVDKWELRGPQHGETHIGRPYDPAIHCITRRKVDSTSAELQEARKQITELTAKLRKQITELTAKLKDSEAAHAAAKADLTVTLDALRKAQGQLATQVKNASGNGVLVRHDGFSKPINVPYQPGARSGPPVFPTYLKTAEMLKDWNHCGAGASMFKTVTYILQSGKDGFGRAIYREGCL